MLSQSTEEPSNKPQGFSSSLAKNKIPISIGILLFALSFFLRAWRLSSTPDIFVSDEALYVNIAIKLPQYGQLMAFGSPWFVHPPLFYLLQSAFFQLSGINSVTLSTVFTSRITSAFYSSLTTLAVFVLVTKISNYKIGAISAIVLAFEPYALKYGRMVLLESVVILFVVLALYMYNSADIKSDMKKFFVGGVLFGTALLIKELAFYLLFVLAVWVILSHFVTKTRFNIKGTIAFVSTGIVMYLGYVIWALSNDAPAFLSTNFVLLERVTWIVRNTGYTAPNYTSFYSDLTGAMNIYLMTYVLFVLSVVSCVYLLYRYRDRTSVMFTSWLAGSAVFFGGIGIHNAQFITYLTVPAAVISGYTLAKFVSEYRKLNPRLKKLSYAALMLLVIIISYNVFVWYSVHGVGTDNAVTQSINWIQSNVPSGEKIWTSYGYQYFLPQYKICDLGSLSNLQLLKDQGIHYFVFSPRWTTNVNKSILDYVEGGQLVAVFYGRSNQQIDIYYIPQPV